MSTETQCEPIPDITWVEFVALLCLFAGFALLVSFDWRLTVGYALFSFGKCLMNAEAAKKAVGEKPAVKGE